MSVFPKEDTQMSNKLKIKRYPTSLVIREMISTATIEYHLIATRMASMMAVYQKHR